jgi:hypothetical protein
MLREDGGCCWPWWHALSGASARAQGTNGRVVMLAAVVLMVVLSLAGPAAAEMSNTRVPLSFTVPTCAGELVTIEGTLQVLTREELDPAGGRHVFGHFTFQGQGTSASGTRYVVFLSSTFAHNFPAGGSEVSTNTVPSVVIRQGESVPDDDSITRVALHFTMNANGDVVANFENGKGDCQ